MRKFFFAALAMAAALAGCKPAVCPVLDIEGGKIQGVETAAKGVYVFKGIPFAAPPVGELRWKEPQPVVPWEGVKVADTYGPGAMQAPHDSSNPWTSEFYWQDPEFSEDCLYLNVFTPAPGKPGKALPVAMWIHGGAYTGGWAYEPEFDGKVWAQKGVVMVTINYRLGIFGFLNHPLLAEESPNGVSGNYGILDQIAALRWIHENIAAFGGDPDNITILGQSAGAGSVKTLVSSPLTDGLIKKAIIQSGGGVNLRPAGAPVAPVGSQMEMAGNAWKQVFDWAGYDTLEKMRAASTQDIFDLSNRYRRETGQFIRVTTSPVVDGYAYPETFAQAAQAGRIADVPYMIGSTLDDMGMLANGIDNFCFLREDAGKDAFAYQFARRLPTDGRSGVLQGAFHSSELWFMFKSLRFCWRPFTPGDYDLAEQMITRWTNFSKYGNPNKPGDSSWTPFTRENPKYMVFKLDDSDKVASGMGDRVVADPLPR